MARLEIKTTLCHQVSCAAVATNVLINKQGHIAGEYCDGHAVEAWQILEEKEQLYEKYNHFVVHMCRRTGF